MKSVLKQISTCLLALLVLFSTVSFTVQAHYCGTKLVSKTMFKKANNCGMEIEPSAQDTSSCKLIKKNCCRDEQSLVKGQEELQQSHLDFTLPQLVILNTVVYYYFNSFEGLQENVVPFSGYKQLKVVRPIHKLDEVYLI